MMNRILYECHFEFSPVMLVPLVLMIGILLMPSLLKHDSLKRGEHINLKLVKKICYCMLFYVVFDGVISTYMLFDMYRKTAIAYQKGDYQIVEGYVENFDPMPYGGHQYETFEIKDIKFQYSDYTIMVGYHNAKSHGGVINGNGQYLIIGYVRYNGANIIVYIEEVPEKNYMNYK